MIPYFKYRLRYSSVVVGKLFLFPIRMKPPEMRQARPIVLEAISTVETAVSGRISQLSFIKETWRSCCLFSQCFHSISALFNILSHVERG